MSEKKLPNGMKLVFAPGCFDNFEGTQEELDELVKEIEQGFEDGSFFENATELALDDLSDEEIESITNRMGYFDLGSPDRKLQ